LETRFQTAALFSNSSLSKRRKGIFKACKESEIKIGGRDSSRKKQSLKMEKK